MSSDITSALSADVDDQDQAAVAAVPGRIAAAWAAHDATAFASVFTENGHMILPGAYRKGRNDIRDFMAEGFNSRYAGSRVTGTPRSITFLDDQAAVLVTEGGVIPAGQEKVPDRDRILASWVVVKRNDQWQLASYQNCPRGV